MSNLFRDVLVNENDGLLQQIWWCLKASNIYTSRIEHLANFIKDDYVSVLDFIERKDEFRNFINESTSINDSTMYNEMMDTTNKHGISEEMKRYRAKLNRASLKLYEDVGGQLYGIDFTNANT
jgi:uncharacterized protein YicC (UPF0701 family)